ncbi:MAG: dockerin type I domain-containing protein [Bacteroidota bacterium]
MKSSVLRIILISMVIVLDFNSFCQAQAWSFKISGATNTYIMGINDNQWVAGYYTDATGTHGFVYNQVDTIVVNATGAVNTYLYGINNSNVAVGAYNSGSNANNIGFLYNLNTHVASVITSWLSGYQQVTPYKINDVGDVVGSYHLSTNNWIFTMIGSINTGSLHYNYNPTYGYGLNNFGTVAGFYINGGVYHGLTRSILGVYTSFDYPGAFKTRAHGINDSGIIVGEYNSTHGFMYKPNQPYPYQELTISGVSELHPYDVNNSGYVVGYYRDNTSNFAGFILMDRFNPELHFNDSALTNMPLGVAADGKANIILSIKRLYGNTPISTVKIKLEDINLNPTVKIGTIGSSAATATSTEMTVNVAPYANQFDFTYVSPIFYSETPSNEFYREVKAKITLHSNVTNSDFFCEKIIRIIRTPVLLVHGLDSDGGAFRKCADYLIATGRYNEDIVECVDYKGTNQVAFEENAFILPTFIAKITDRCRKTGYEVKSFDVVAHSMGAILSRLYLQSDNYNNDIHKLIPVNSPLSGSQGANLIQTLIPMGIRKVLGIGGQAFDDLAVTSNAIRVILNGPNLNKNIVPTHTITSTASDFTPAVRHSIIGTVIYLAIASYFNYDYAAFSVPYVYSGPSDLVVAENSQYAGVTANSHINEEWHCGICSNTDAEAKIRDLLELPVQSAEFSPGGFHPPLLTWLGQKPGPLNAAPITDTIHFQLPAAGTLTANGDSLNVTVTGTSGVQRLALIINETADTLFFSDTAATAMTWHYKVSSLSCGKVKMIALGWDANSNFLVDSTFIIVQPSAAPDSLYIIRPADSLVLSKGLPGSLFVSCLFADGVRRDVSAVNGLQYQLLTNNAMSLGGGNFKGLQTGSDLLTVTYAGLTVSLPIHIGLYYHRYDTVRLAVDICAGSSYNFNGQLLDTAGIYYKDYINQWGGDSTVVLKLTISMITPAGAGNISGPVLVIPGQAGVTYTLAPIANAYSYHWTLPIDVEGVSTSDTIRLNFGLINGVVPITVNAVNGCGSGTSSTLLVNVHDLLILKGTLNYDNASGTPIGGAILNLSKSGSLVGKDTTDLGGAFLFNNLVQGNYMASVSTNKAWGGVNSVDALLIMKHFVGTITLTGLRKKAADLNASSTINSVDALLAMKRFVGINSSFPMGDWLWDSNADTLHVNSDLTRNIKGLCYGDVNGSYNPAAKIASSMQLYESGNLVWNSKVEVEVPFSVKETLRISSASLVISYKPQDVSVINVIPFGINEDGANAYFISKVTEDEVRIAWFSLQPLVLKAGDILFSLQVHAVRFGAGLFGLEAGSIITDENAEEIPGAAIVYPGLQNPSQGFSLFGCAPNPMRDQTDISYYVPAPGSLHIYLSDMLGSKKEVMPVFTVTEGMHSFHINSEHVSALGLQNGIYWFVAEYDDGKNCDLRTSRVVIVR